MYKYKRHIQSVPFSFHQKFLKMHPATKRGCFFARNIILTVLIVYNFSYEFFIHMKKQKIMKFYFSLDLQHSNFNTHHLSVFSRCVFCLKFDLFLQFLQLVDRRKAEKVVVNQAVKMAFRTIEHIESGKFKTFLEALISTNLWQFSNFY